MHLLFIVVSGDMKLFNKKFEIFFFESIDVCSKLVGLLALSRIFLVLLAIFIEVASASVKLYIFRILLSAQKLPALFPLRKFSFTKRKFKFWWT